MKNEARRTRVSHDQVTDAWANLCADVFSVWLVSLNFAVYCNYCETRAPAVVSLSSAEFPSTFAAEYPNTLPNTSDFKNWCNELKKSSAADFPVG